MGFLVTQNAEVILHEIWLYILHQSGSPEVATRFLDSFTDVFHLLAQSPSMGRRRDEIKPGSRAFLSGDYIIVYSIRDADVLIEEVIHGRRKLPKSSDDSKR